MDLFLRDPYPLSWLYSIQFVGGMIIFFTGFIINISSDNILFKLRKMEMVSTAFQMESF